MKSKFNQFYALAVLMLISCGNAETSAVNPGEGKSIATPESNEKQAGGIVGEWEQQYTCIDKNGNNKLEPEEKKASDTPLGFNWFRFNADGTCLREKDVEIKGSYQIQEKNGTKELVGDDLNYPIIELSDKELILGGEGVFMVYKRIK